MLESDRISYTLLDANVAGILSDEAPSRLVPAAMNREDEVQLIQSAYLASRMLRNVIGSLRRSLPGGNGSSWPISATMIDPAEDFCLDTDGQLVCSRPDKLTWIAGLRMQLGPEYYLGPLMQSYENSIAEALKKHQKMGTLGELLSRENLLSKGDFHLQRQMGRLANKAAASELYSLINEFPWDVETRYISPDEKPPYQEDPAWSVKKILSSTGLDTRVLANNETMTLGRYIAREKTGLGPAYAMQMNEAFGGRIRAVRKLEFTGFHGSNKVFRS